MIVIISGLGWIVASTAGIFWVLLGGGVLVMLKSQRSPRRILKEFRACPLSAHMAPGLNDLLAGLAQRAGLPETPTLYYVPSATVNAFAVGTRDASAVAITDAMLRTFSPREIAGVFAHEVSHIRINDLWVIAFADLCSRLAWVLSTAGQILLLLNLPLLMFTAYGVNWAVILMLVFMPLMIALIQLSLSRTREYNADLGAIELTGDPRGLVMALEKMERYHRTSLRQSSRPQSRLAKFSWLRTHPLTEKRIARLRRIEPAASRLPRSYASATIWRAYPTVKRHLPEHLSRL
ncbi:MAG TPA: zinc metalloprotease HtpX [Nitrococcus sp.]|nr:zinc metalloprotease HtpX [Nitrococcus sp.]